MYICALFMDHLLHIDTSAELCSIAISRDGVILDLVHGREVRNHAASINLMIKQSLENTNISMTSISAIVVCAGPGSYTGLRIAMATAKGICFAANKPLILDNKLHLLSLKTPVPNNNFINIASILLAREKEYFISIYNNQHVCIIAPLHVTESELVELLNGTENLHIISDVPIDTFYKLKVNFLSFDENITIDYNSWASFAQIQYKCQEFVNLATATPLYLKQVYTHK